MLFLSTHATIINLEILTRLNNQALRYQKIPNIGIKLHFKILSKIQLGQWAATHSLSNGCLQAHALVVLVVYRFVISFIFEP